MRLVVTIVFFALRTSTSSILGVEPVSVSVVPGGITEQMRMGALRFLSEVASCEAEQQARDEAVDLDMSECNPLINAQIRVQGIGEAHVGAEIGRGSAGVAFEIPEANMILKIAHASSNSLCSEKSGLRILDGLDKRVPHVFEVDEGLGDECVSRAIVMEKVGDADWRFVVTKIDRDFYLRFASLLEAVRDLHAHGLVHIDLHAENIRVSLEDPNFVALIDFGKMNAFVDHKGHLSSVFTRKIDARGLLLVLDASVGSSVGDQPWYAQFEADMLSVRKPDDVPPLDKWIPFFRAEAEKLRD
jgi:serine/threonine protein kinase